MITAITIENFKGIGEPVRLQIAPLTLIFGENNAGNDTIFGGDGNDTLIGGLGTDQLHGQGGADVITQ